MWTLTWTQIVWVNREFLGLSPQVQTCTFQPSNPASWNIAQKLPPSSSPHVRLLWGKWSTESLHRKCPRSSTRRLHWRKMGTELYISFTLRILVVENLLKVLIFVFQKGTDVTCSKSTLFQPGKEKSWNTAVCINSAVSLSKVKQCSVKCVLGEDYWTKSERHWGSGCLSLGNTKPSSFIALMRLQLRASFRSS